MAEGFMGLKELEDNFKRFAEDISSTTMEAAMKAAARVFRTALIQATPTDTGQAKRNVIIYKRKDKRLFSTKKADISLLIGYARREAYYMYWYEKGSKQQASKKFVRGVFDGVQDKAMEAAIRIMKARVARGAA